LGGSVSIYYALKIRVAVCGFCNAKFLKYIIDMEIFDIYNIVGKV